MTTNSSNFPFNRRTFLVLAASAGAISIIPSAFRGSRSKTDPTPFNPHAWKPVRYPIPLPDTPSNEDLLRYQVVDDLILPEGFTYDVIAKWGDRFGAVGHEIQFGFNCDFTGLIPFPGRPHEYFLVVNHEYVSARPWTAGYQDVYGEELAKLRVVPNPDALNGVGFLELDGEMESFESVSPKGSSPICRAVRELSRKMLAEVGVSILHVEQKANRLTVIKDSIHHKRISGAGRTNIPSSVPFTFTGPARDLLKSTPVLGTLANCGGTVTPWGTFLTCEENFQDWLSEQITPEGEVLSADAVRWYADNALPNSVPVQWEGAGAFANLNLDHRHYGWVTEIDPVSGALKKHTALGRFRHENVALLVKEGEPLVAYMGDDRRGGHVWKYVSTNVVTDPSDPQNSKLFEDGTLYVAKLLPDQGGEWIPLIPETPLVDPAPEHCATKHLQLPKRPEGGFTAVGASGCQYPFVPPTDWKASIEGFAGRSFRDLNLGSLIVKKGDHSREHIQGILCLDAFALANAVGGTPLARPEGIQINPYDGSIYIAFSDSTGRSIGSPDARIFPFASATDSRRYGDLFRFSENGDHAKFSWARWVSSGEVADGGAGFACADNILVDSNRNLWMCCDVTTEALNVAVQRDDTTRPGTKNFQGIFGNNSLFCLETFGTDIGVPKCFAIGPMECELTGPTFTADGQVLLVSVQHPGENSGVRTEDRPDQTKEFVVARGDTSVFRQTRVVPVGSNFPSKKLGVAPRPAVVAIRRS